MAIKAGCDRILLYPPYTADSSILGEKAKVRTALLKCFSNIKFLARQGIPFRGPGDDSNSNYHQHNRPRVGGGDSEFDNWLKKKQVEIQLV